MWKEVVGGLVRCRLVCQDLLVWAAKSYERICSRQLVLDQGFETRTSCLRSTGTFDQNKKVTQLHIKCCRLACVQFC